MPIKKILCFNIDFRFVRNLIKNPQIIEVNTDSLSRYTIAQNVGYSPRRTRFEHIKKNAEKNQANLSVLYHSSLLKDAKKSMRWGINTPDELKQNSFFQAHPQGIYALGNKLAHQVNNWVLLLGTSPSDVQHIVQANASNTVFIGHDLVFDAVCNNKFLTTQFMPADYQPQSTLLTHGASPKDSMKKIRDEIGSSDIVLKPLCEHSGIGVYRAKNTHDLEKILTIMHQSHIHTQGLKLKMNYQFENPEHYWAVSQSHNPYVLAQAYAPSEVDNQTEITYRAVCTAYISSSNIISLEIDCMYPKRSNAGDFRSNVSNKIAASEIEVLHSDQALKASLCEGVTQFIAHLGSYTPERLRALYPNHSTYRDDDTHSYSSDGICVKTDSLVHELDIISADLPHQEDKTILSAIASLGELSEDSIKKLPRTTHWLSPSEYLDKLSNEIDVRYQHENPAQYSGVKRLAALFAHWRANEADETMQWKNRCQGINLLKDPALKFIYHYLLSHHDKYDTYKSLKFIKLVMPFISEEKQDSNLLHNLVYAITLRLEKLKFLDQSSAELEHLAAEVIPLLQQGAEVSPIVANIPAVKF
ncbi:MAG TPA: hypothetical protein VI522_03695 [Gammaproteobacteria bacterium]|nr:hypothetical protein [Gammaproteobacteria bacterium]